MKPPDSIAGGPYMAARVNPSEVTSLGVPTSTALRSAQGATTATETPNAAAARRQPTERTATTTTTRTTR